MLLFWAAIVITFIIIIIIVIIIIIIIIIISSSSSSSSIPLKMMAIFKHFCNCIRLIHFLLNELFWIWFALSPKIYFFFIFAFQSNSSSFVSIVP